MKTWQENLDLTLNTSKKNSEQVACKYCKKVFRRESTLQAHSCEPRRRALQEKEVGVQFGLRAWLRFYEITQGSSKLKTYADFSSNSFYLAFVKFGRHIVAIRAVNPLSFIDYVIKENKKIDRWCDEETYVTYLYQYIRKEQASDTLERGLNEMQEWADSNGLSLVDYFKEGNPNRLCQHIANGRISPWILYNCNTGIQFLSDLNEEQLAKVMPWIDPTYWEKRFQDFMADAEWIKSILSDAGL